MLLSSVSFYPSDFLYRKGTIIENNADILIHPQSKLLPKDIYSNTKMLNDTVVQVEMLMTTVNNLAYSIHAEDGFMPFVKMSLMLSIVQIVPVLGAFAFMRKQDNMQVVVKMMSSILPSKS